jgi:hypothetical protein
MIAFYQIFMPWRKHCPKMQVGRSDKKAKIAFASERPYLSLFIRLDCLQS